MKPTTKIVSKDELVLNSNNPRLIKDEKFKKLVNSIKEFPEMLNLRPIVVNEQMVILGGNMRFRACIEAGLKEVPITIAKGLTAEQEAEFIIKDNASFGEWDWDTLANEWDSTKLGEWGIDAIKQDWNKLDYIEEADQPSFNKQNTITIIVPVEFTDEVRDIEVLIKSILSEKYSGCEVK